MKLKYNKIIKKKVSRDCKTETLIGEGFLLRNQSSFLHTQVWRSQFPRRGFRKKGNFLVSFVHLIVSIKSR